VTHHYKSTTTREAMDKSSTLIQVVEIVLSVPQTLRDVSNSAADKILSVIHKHIASRRYIVKVHNRKEKQITMMFAVWKQRYRAIKAKKIYEKLIL
jgi:hypothetical protein